LTPQISGRMDPASRMMVPLFSNDTSSYNVKYSPPSVNGRSGAAAHTCRRGRDAGPSRAPPGLRGVRPRENAPGHGGGNRRDRKTDPPGARALPGRAQSTRNSDLIWGMGFHLRAIPSSDFQMKFFRPPVSVTSSGFPL